MIIGPHYNLCQFFYLYLILHVRCLQCFECQRTSFRSKVINSWSPRVAYGMKSKYWDQRRYICFKAGPIIKWNWNFLEKIFFRGILCEKKKHIVEYCSVFLAWLMIIFSSKNKIQNNKAKPKIKTIIWRMLSLECLLADTILNQLSMFLIRFLFKKATCTHRYQHCSKFQVNKARQSSDARL